MTLLKLSKVDHKFANCFDSNVFKEFSVFPPKLRIKEMTSTCQVSTIQNYKKITEHQIDEVVSRSGNTTCPDFG